MSVELKTDGIHTVCRECSRPVLLPMSNDMGEPVDFAAMSVKGQKMALNFAALVVCRECTDRDERRAQEREGRAAWAERLKLAGVPATFHSLSFDEMIRSGKRAAAVARLEEWASHKDPGGVMLWGSVGAGKTRLAGTAAVIRLKRWPLRWVSVAVLFAQLSAAFSDDERKQALKVLTGSGGLVLDDLDKVALSEGSKGRLFVAIDNRINAGAPLLVTANLSPRELTARFGEAIASRLIGYCQAFEMDGPDRRTRLAA